MSKDFLQIMKERGFVHQCTDEEALSAYLAAGDASAYVGYDCTAKSLHVGSLVSIMMLRWFEKCGHKPIVLLGDFTTRVGDPSGKDEARPYLSNAQIAENMSGIGKVFGRLLPNATIVKNSTWLDKLSAYEYLQVTKFFSVNRMMTMDSVKLRLERDQHLTALEFNYMILQAYDFAELAKNPGCRLQIGGSDQWGNIVMGVELKRKRGYVLDENYNIPLFGLTTPLITTASGAKMGKTAEGAVWLDAEMLSPYDYWQFWRNTEDADVGRFLRLFTELPLDEIKKLEALEGAEINQAKIVLANEATKLCHGEKAAQEAAETARKTFEEGAAGDALPEITLPRSELDSGMAAFELFKRAGLAKSGGEARRLIKGGGARVNDEKLTDETAQITSGSLNQQGFIKLSAGKKRHALVKVQ